MRRILVMSLMVVMVFPGITFAYEPGLLFGETLQNGISWARNNHPERITDGDPDTYGSVGKSAYHIFPDQMNISAIYLRSYTSTHQTAVPDSVIRFLDAENNIIHQLNVRTIPSGSMYSVEVRGVKRVDYYGLDGMYDYIYDYELYGSPATNPPENVSVSLGGLTPDSVTLFLSATQADSYRIYRDGQEIATVPGDSETYTDIGIDPDTTYQYKIVAENEYGSTESEVLKIQTMGNIKNLRVVDRTTDSVEFAWDESPVAESYRVLVTVTDEDSPTETRTELDTTQTSVTVSDLRPGQRVKVEVSGYLSTYGTFGTASTQTIISSVDVPSPDDMPTPTDVLRSAWSFASNFWWLFVLGAAILLTPSLFLTMRKARENGSKNREGRNSKRDIQRDIRLQLRKGD